MGTSDVFKVFKIARAVGECNLKSFQNITSDHKSQNARAVHAMFCILYPQQNNPVTLLCRLQVHFKETFNGFQQMLAITITATDKLSQKLFS